MDETKLKLAYFEAKSVARIMLFGSLSAPFAELRNVFECLALDSRCSFLLHRLPFVGAFDGLNLRLSRLAEGTSLLTECIGLRRLSADGAPIFEWIQERDGWAYAAELTESLLTASFPCHQYLSDRLTDDATFVLSKGEYSDEIVAGHMPSDGFEERDTCF